MSLRHPTNPLLWADGTPRSQNNGFTNGLGEPINYRALDMAAKRSRESSQSVDAVRRGESTRKSKAQALRDALAAGAALTSRELSAATGIHMDLVPSLLQWSVSNGTVKQLTDKKPFRYQLPAKPHGGAYTKAKKSDDHREAA
jgi:hypothetical protein